MKQTLKEQLVKYMIENGNKFTYTQMIKALLKLTRPNETYDWREHRGHFATNFSRPRGYMVNGGGNCGVYKGEDGLWSGRFFTEKEIKSRKIKNALSSLVKDIRIKERDNMFEYKETGYYPRASSQWYSNAINHYAKQLQRIK